MKHFLLILSVLFSGYAFGEDIVLEDFETTTLHFGGFGGASGLVVENPDMSGINTSDSVYQYTDGAETWAGVAEPEPVALDLANYPYIKMKVYAPAAGEVRLKLEAQDGSLETVETPFAMTADMVGVWTEVTFDFSGVTAPFNKLTLFFDFGTTTPDDVWYFDDVTMSDTPPAGSLTITPEDGTTDVPVYTKIAFQSTLPMRKKDDSQITDGDLASILVFRKTDQNGEDVYYSASISDNKKSIRIVPDNLLDANTNYFVSFNASLIEYNSSASVDSMAVTFTTTSTAPTMVTYDDFEGNSIGATYTAMGDPAGQLTSPVTDPENADNSVLKWSKGGSWGGWERFRIDLPQNIDLSNGSVVSMNVLSPKATSVMIVLANMEDDNADGVAKVSLTQDVAGTGWETLYFNFTTGTTDTYNHIFVYIDGGVADPQNYFIDNIQGPALMQDNTGLTARMAENSLSIYPNPVTDQLVINSEQTMRSVAIYDVTGSLVSQDVCTSKRYSKDVSSLNAGMYFIRVTTDDHAVLVKKIMKN
ncbi:MAG TPA: T9SS type A sorting domain-containing protein [Bacteroidales bacterium]|nr:T9SS type A sorting domain-containing protein [Bacteroidales bacterium]